MTGPYIDRNLVELFSYAPENERWREKEVSRILAGGDNEEFRVPAADNGADLFFNNRDMLDRFTALCLPDQEGLLKAVRGAMAKEGVETIRLTVPWSKTEERVVTIRKINFRGCLNIYI